MTKKYKLKKCKKCGSYNIKIITQDKKIGWTCECGWEGKIPSSETVSEEEYLKYAENL